MSKYRKKLQAAIAMVIARDRGTDLEIAHQQNPAHLVNEAVKLADEMDLAIQRYKARQGRVN